MKKLLSIAAALISLSVSAQVKEIKGTVTDMTGPLPGVNIIVKGSSTGTQSDFGGHYSIMAEVGDVLVFSFVGYLTAEKTVGSAQIVNITLEEDLEELQEVVVAAYGLKRSRKALGYAVSEVNSRQLSRRTSRDVARVLSGKASGVQITNQAGASGTSTNVVIRGYTSIKGSNQPLFVVDGVPYNSKILDSTLENESYKEIIENDFENVLSQPLSTFSIDVDKAGYSNVRRMINNGQNVPSDAVKIEEMINYFDYEYKQPNNVHPFSINTEFGDTPWNNKTKLVKIGLQGKRHNLKELPASNLTFLIDVSGSMGNPNKLPLLKSAFKVLINQLRSQDKVSIVVYAGAAGIVLEPTSGDNRQKILEALENLEAGGSTAGGEGIKLAYKLAEKNFIKNGNNRVILATDGDFNVGPSSDKAMERLIIEKRESGVFLSVLGFGYGNYKDSKLEAIADKGNGNHAYVDSMQEAQKIFGREFGGTLYTIAKDVKIQIEFNPSKVQGYRLIGYENRLLNDQDFEDDTKDAGELGSGHTVTAIYEIILSGTDNQYLKRKTDLKYSKNVIDNEFDEELFTIKFRYKKPDSDSSILMTHVQNIYEEKVSEDFYFVSAVALFGMQLKNSKYYNNADITKVIELAEKGLGNDKDGYRAEFIRLVKSYNQSK